MGDETAHGRPARSMLMTMVLGLVSACAGETPDRPPVGGADPARGLTVIRAAGCAACHQIPGVSWPEGAVGPPLEGFGDRSLIAGRLPNQPEPLAAFIRNAPAFVPDGGMPPMPITEQEARDAAAYLLSLEPR